MPRGVHSGHRRGPNHYRWNRGPIISSDGYVKVRVDKGHPLSDPNGYAYEHDLVAVEMLGRDLTPGEVVHHKNGDKQDNRPENLEVLTRSEHNRHHNAERERRPDGRWGGPNPTSGGRLLDGRTWDEYPQVGA